MLNVKRNPKTQLVKLVKWALRNEVLQQAALLLSNHLLVHELKRR